MHRRMFACLLPLALTACMRPVTSDEAREIFGSLGNTPELETRIDQLESTLAALIIEKDELVTLNAGLEQRLAALEDMFND